MMLFGKAIEVDVICQHTKEGVIIPMRCRLADEDAHMCFCRTMCDAHLASKYAEAYLKLVHIRLRMIVRSKLMTGYV